MSTSSTRPATRPPLPLDHPLSDATALYAYARRTGNRAVLVAGSFEALTGDDARRLRFLLPTDSVVFAMAAKSDRATASLKQRTALAALIHRWGYHAFVDFDGTDESLSAIVEALDPDRVVRLAGVEPVPDAPSKRRAGR